MQHGRARALLFALALVLVAACGGGGGATEGVRSVPPGEAVAAAAEPDTVVIDVRTPQEYAEGHLAGARNVPLAGDFEAAVERLPRDERYVLYCRTGSRSRQAAQLMEQLGFTDVLEAGGLSGLAEAGAEVAAG